MIVARFVLRGVRAARLQLGREPGTARMRHEASLAWRGGSKHNGDRRARTTPETDTLHSTGRPSGSIILISQRTSLRVGPRGRIHASLSFAERDLPGKDTIAASIYRAPHSSLHTANIADKREFWYLQVCSLREYRMSEEWKASNARASAARARFVHFGTPSLRDFCVPIHDRVRELKFREVRVR